MLRNIYQFALCLVVIMITSCDGGQVDCGSRPELNVDQGQLDSEIAEIEAYLEGQSIEYETDPSGIRYTVIEAGTGEGPNYCATVSIDYTGRELGSTENFISGIDAQIPLRNNSVVPGFKIAIANMNRNAEYKVYVPASLLTVKGISQPQPANLPLGENVEFRIRLTSY
ncbi:hypothetical protein QYS49_03460 [Marivirga salinae]|uniref:peptidylprolyl isomerase n=1 Tax=Marivirga salinarum TaxID=3059078 RepID=A0AA49GAQ2_9BACT|nr:FKBP-type peptidyl-prolyl cis-trans isomerase [Marivirga sp. BDSF4-3]WKK76413.1 hypothetical protein QYS49_03460 [Marivirga sp. BDSF4-3]